MINQIIFDIIQLVCNVAITGCAISALLLGQRDRRRTTEIQHSERILKDAESCFEDIKKYVPFSSRTDVSIVLNHVELLRKYQKDIEDYEFSQEIKKRYLHSFKLQRLRYANMYHKDLFMQPASVYIDGTINNEISLEETLERIRTPNTNIIAHPEQMKEIYNFLYIPHQLNHLETSIDKKQPFEEAVEYMQKSHVWDNNIDAAMRGKYRDGLSGVHKRYKELKEEAKDETHSINSK